MAIKSINWYLDIEEYFDGVLYNSFSAGPLARSWDHRSWSDSQTTGNYMTLQAMVDEINNLFEESWANGDGDAKNLYEVVPTLIPSSETYSAPTAGQAVIRFEFRRTYPIYPLEEVPSHTFRIALRTGPHGSKTFQPEMPSYPAATITYTNDSNVKATTLPYWSSTAMVTDKPPIAPDVVFVPFMGISNKVLLLLDGNMGDLDLAPIIIKDTDTAFLAEELYSQLKLSVAQQDVRTYIEENPVTLNYKSDDPVATYQIFRTTTKPTSYKDFNVGPNPIATVSELIAPGKPATPAAYVSTIQPNVKYYYCIRGIDIHGNISNPTEVFQLEMIDNNGQISYTLKVVNMDTPPPKNVVLPGRRFLYVAPALQQSVFNRTAFNGSNEVQDRPQNIKLTNLPPSNVLGYLEEDGESVWQKKFKIRVTSAKTGKKFDLNITVKNTGVTNP
tara:strand:+ start:471 stop:1802 length:1332 start_codon:yes stop_codon:yes gene_type:complete